MILELASPYIPVVVVILLWALAMRPVLRLIHASSGARTPSSARGRVLDRVARRRRSG